MGGQAHDQPSCGLGGMEVKKRQPLCLWRASAFASLASILVAAGLGCETLPAADGLVPDASDSTRFDVQSPPDAGPGDAAQAMLPAPNTLDAARPNGQQLLDGGADAVDLDAGTDMDATTGPLTCAELSCDPMARCVDAADLAQAGIDAGMLEGARCLCNEGYVGDGTRCERDECIALGGALPCAEHATCTDPSAALGDKVCSCEAGYREAPGAMTLCARDECVPLAGEAPACGEHTTCSDPDPALDNAECLCATGYGSCDTGDAPIYACSTQLTTNPSHCGACGHACAGSNACQDGACKQSAWRLAGGGEIMCAFTGAPKPGDVGPVTCWGNNTERLINDTGERQVTAPGLVEPIGSADILDIALGSYHVCYVSTLDEDVRCFGRDGLWLGNASGSSDGVHRATVPGVTKVAVGQGFSCALNDKGVVSCWGSKSYLGGTPSSDTDYPIKVLENARDIVAEGFMACALMNNGWVRCWGHPEYGVPNIIAFANNRVLDDVVQLIGGTSGPGAPYACALTRAGEVYCWGTSPWFAATGGTTSDFLHPAPVDLGGRLAVEIAGRGYAACARTDRAGEGVVCWGVNSGGVIDPSSPASAPLRPQAVPGTEDLIDIEAAGEAMCGRRDDGQVVCWGYNQLGELGDGTTEARTCVREVLGLPAAPPATCP